LHSVPVAIGVASPTLTFAFRHGAFYKLEEASSASTRPLPEANHVQRCDAIPVCILLWSSWAYHWRSNRRRHENQRRSQKSKARIYWPEVHWRRGRTRGSGQAVHEPEPEATSCGRDEPLP